MAAGTTLLEAARMAQLPVATACGASQLCGRCGLQIVEGGESLASETPLEAHIKQLNRVDVELRLSCRLTVEADLVVTAQYW